MWAWAAINYLDVIRNGSFVELFVLGLLALVSITSWGTIALKAGQLSRARSQSLSFLETFWKATRLEAIYEVAQRLDASPLSRVFVAGYDEITKLAQSNKDPDKTKAESGAMSERMGGIENVQRALSRASSAQITELEARVSFLGTVGSAAPFVGLFGTVM